MGRFTRILDVIQDYLGRLTVTQKLLVASLVVVMLMTLFVVQQYAGETTRMAVLPGGSAQEQETARVALVSSGFDPTFVDGQVMVSPAAVHRARAFLVESGAAPADTSIMFNNLPETWSWTMPSEQQGKLEVIALQNELDAIISAMSGIEGARVILNLRQKRTLGAPATRPSASVTVFPSSGSLGQKTVDSIANLVASSRGIDIERVKVIDGVNNRQHTARAEGDFAASSYQEYVATIEDRKRNQLADLLAYIPGVNVSVHAQVDNTRAEKQTTSYMKEGEGTVSPLTSESTRATEQTRAARGGEPGVRSNVGAQIGGSNSGPGEMSTDNSTDTMFMPKVGEETSHVVDPRGRPTKINAIVNIPRPYFAAIWSHGARQQAEDGADEPASPSDEDLVAIIASETQRVRDEVEKLIDTSASPGDGPQYTGEVVVSMIPSVVELGLVPDGVSNAGTILGFPTGTLTVQDTIKTVGLGGLALVSLLALVMTATKAAKREKLPSAEELVGIPKELDENEEVIGEAVVAEASLDGLELSDEDMRRRSMEEQVGELVDENPEDAARLLGKWILEEQP